MTPSRDIARLVEIMTALRDPTNGCPWDIEQTFETIAHEMLSASEIDADFALNLLPMLARLPAGVMGQWVPHIFQRFTDDGDRSAFGLMNAVTSVARDVRDPEVRWRLEALGGGVPARLVVAPASATGVTAVAAHRE